MGLSMRTVGKLIVYEAADSPQWKFGEADTCVRTFNGPYADLFAMRPTRYEPMEGTGESMIVQDCSLRKAKLNQGVLTVNLIGVSPFDTSVEGTSAGPLREVVEIDWVAVQKPLQSNPIWRAEGASSTDTLVDYSGWARIEKWKNEPNLALKVGGTESAPVYKFKDGTEEVTLTAAETRAARKILRGVEGYNIYAPLIRKTTTFARQPVPGNAGFIEGGGPVVDVAYPEGYEWLKTACRDIQQQDKSWERFEEWTGSDEWDEDLYPISTLSSKAPGAVKKPSRAKAEKK